MARTHATRTHTPNKHNEHGIPVHNARYWKCLLMKKRKITNNNIEFIMQKKNKGDELLIKALNLQIC